LVFGNGCCKKFRYPTNKIKGCLYILFAQTGVFMDDNFRILVIDDDPGVRDAFREILVPSAPADITARGAALFGETAPNVPACAPQKYDLTLAENCEQGIGAVEQALWQHRPFAVAFIDMNMPGIDGAETSRRIWALDPKIKLVIVTAFSEYRPCDIIQIVQRDDIFYLRKPFNPEEIKQFANALTQFWNTERERETLAAELDDMNQNLQKKVKEQAAMLVQSEKMSSLGVLAAGVAHEINNPICFVHGNLDTIRKYSVLIKKLLFKYQTLEDSALRYAHTELQPLIEEIHAFKTGHKIDFILEDIVNLAEESLDGTRRVRNIVKELSGFSHMDDAEQQPLDVNQTIDGAINMIGSELRRKTEIIRSYGQLPPVNGFPHKIGQVLLNVLMNAFQAVGNNGRINITTRQLLPASRGELTTVEICVADNGCGVPKNEISKIFDPFYTTKPVGEGTGLGLSISYDIVKSHGGEMVVNSTENKGTSVRIVLPVDTGAKAIPAD
jgi:signal transduction histidine kinase